MATQLYASCLALARVIDVGVAKNEVPSNARDLPRVLKQVCRGNHDAASKSMIMVLLLSARTACDLRWFSEDDAREISALADEMAACFCRQEDLGSCPSGLSLVPTIMSRFYPSLRLGKILASLEVKPGYGAYFRDFRIVREDFQHSTREKVELLVSRTDITETSSCLVSPQQVSFLVNGLPVVRRTSVDAIPGPQLPTNVTAMLMYGTNLLQAVGKFDGPCVILVTSMSKVNEFDSSSLLEYVPSSVALPDTGVDSDLIEGPSRISLKCPISRRRIKLPVKGQSCKHLQCFDFGNFVEMNSRLPSWRCPHCNQCVCFPDIRVDQTLANILQEVGDDIDDIVVSADGSWRAVMEANHDELRSKNANGVGGIASPVVNLTDINDQMDVDPVSVTIDGNPLPTIAMNATGTVNSELAGDQDNAVAGSLNVSPLPSNLVIGVAAIGGTSHVDLPTAILLPSPTLAAPNHHRQNAGDFSFQEALIPSATAVLTPTPLCIDADAYSVEYGNFPNWRPMNITRVPIAVQALPAPSRARMPAGQRARGTVNQSIPNVPPVHYSQQQLMVRPYPPVHYSQQQHMVRPYPPVQYSQQQHMVRPYHGSCGTAAASYNMDLEQYLNQYLPPASRTDPTPVGLPCHMDIQNSSNRVDQQASPSMPSQLGAAPSQIQGFVSPTSFAAAASSNMISQQASPSMPSRLGAVPSQIQGFAAPNSSAATGSLAAISQQASPGMPSQLGVAPSQIQGFAAPSSFAAAASSTMISQQPSSIMPSQLGATPSQIQGFATPNSSAAAGSLAMISQQASPGMPSQLGASPSQIQGFGAPNSFATAASSTMISQQASPSMPSQLGSVPSQAQGLGAPNSSSAAASLATISERNALPLGRMRGSLSGQALDSFSQLVIFPTQATSSSRQSSGHAPTT